MSTEPNRDREPIQTQSNSSTSAPPDQWLLDYESKDGRLRVEHLGGVDWIDLPIPRRWHRCRPQTRGWDNWVTFVERCRCGAIRINNGRWFDRNTGKRQRHNRRWFNRNTRKRQRHG